MQLFLQFQVILNNAVVYDDVLSRAVAVWMRILLSGPSVRGPASVADTVGPFDRRLLDRFLEFAQLPRSAPDLQLACAIDYRDSCRVVATIFELAQAFDDDRDNFL